MTDTFRALCSELHAAFNTYFVGEEHHRLLVRAATALAQPEPEGPTDEELVRVYQAAYQPAWERGEFHGCHVDGLRAVLARCGRPAIKPVPVPVSERLPGPKDCDAEGRCWWEYPESKRIVYDMNPIDKEEITTPPAYYLQKKHPLCSPNQRWLPHHALPVLPLVVRRTSMVDLSRAAQAVLIRLTQQEYGLDPVDIPNEAGRMACVAAATLRAAADQVVPENAEAVGDKHDDARADQWMRIRYKFLAIAAELEADR